MSESQAYEAPMRRALDLAARGPLVGGNPQVGCVLLDADGRIVAEGWHRGAGTPHAEIDALSQVSGR
jgi:diaminohydroxyphosphoribosylaminopyrimidine deaminase/5-amino-6-(5-phosphoribosylamino)uracil reductase